MLYVLCAQESSPEEPLPRPSPPAAAAIAPRAGPARPAHLAEPSDRGGDGRSARPSAMAEPDAEAATSGTSRGASWAWALGDAQTVPSSDDGEWMDEEAERGALGYSPLKPAVERMWASDRTRFGALLEVHAAVEVPPKYLDGPCTYSTLMVGSRSRRRCQ
jgi:hypothetical protein